jgi:hypothetical protein
VIRLRQVSANITGYLIAGIIVAGCGKDATDALQNRAAEIPSNPYPADGGADQVVDITLSWECSDPDGDPLTYDIYFNTLPPPSLADSNLTQTTFDPGILEKDSVYYWSIVARDDHGHTTAGPIWSFSTLSSIKLIGSYDPADSARSVFVSGNYAFLIAGNNKLLIIDITNPANPTPAGIYYSSDRINNVFVSGNYVYLAAGSLNIVNILDPANPVEIGRYEDPNIVDVFVRDNFAYLAHAPTPGLIILDISDLSNPTFLGNCSLPAGAGRVFVRGDYAYLIDSYWNTGHLQIIDVSDPTNPIRTGGYAEDWGYISDIFVAENYAYIPAFGLNIIDVSDPENPSLAGSYFTRCWKLFVESDYAYIAGGYEDVLKIFEVSDPANPVLVASYDTPGMPSDVFVANGYIYLADGGSGLLILEFVP